MTKRDFWRLFHPAWEKAFGKENISNAFKAAGVRLFNRSRVVAAIKRNISPPLQNAPGPSKTPGSSRPLRKTYKRLQKPATSTSKLQCCFAQARNSLRIMSFFAMRTGALEMQSFMKKKKRKREITIYFLDKAKLKVKHCFLALRRL